MRVLVFEPFSDGHCYQYVHHMLGRLAEEADEVVVATSRRGRESAEFASLLAPFEGRVRFDASSEAPSWKEVYSLAHCRALLVDLREAVRRSRPDHVLVTTGDYLIKPMILRRASGRGGLPGGVPVELCLHGGHRWPAATDARTRLKDAAFALKLPMLPAKVRTVNTYAYERLRAGRGLAARWTSLLPHPVPPPNRLEQAECRRRLGWPEGGRFMGLVAEIDHRKAIGPMLAAFVASSPRPDDRIVLAGRVAPSHREMIDRDHADLLARGQLVLMDHFIDQATSDLILQGLDVVCLPYPGFTNLSSALLHGVAAGRPVLADDTAWLRMMIRRFGFGWACDMTDPASFARGMADAFEGARSYVQAEATSRLLEFHHPANFGETWVEGIRKRQGKPPSPARRTWDWVLEALDEGRRHLM